ncbi:MAG: DUF1987 domain-containing protein [Microscillaceae bacterium]|nr:DUF1987 domain-containing protein [Microscillaceae bacterium]MDW8460835.1 DUF1987 domain-containing protein [Cytophagales bacterium]
MSDIYVEETQTTPEVNFDFRRGIFEIKGVSIPEDTEHFYSSILEKLEDYARNLPTDKTQMNFKFIYINTSTSAVVAKIIKLLESINSVSHPVTVRWYYEEGDEDMRDLGYDFSTFTNLNFILIPCQEIL